MQITDFSFFLNNLSEKPLRVLDAGIPNSKYIPLDLSINNKALELIDVSSSLRLGHYINTHIDENKGLVAFGGYKEVRNIYQRSNYFNRENVEERNIHLGIDLWCPAETPIYVPLQGEIHSFKNNTHYGDYGPTIILKHVINNIEFYTLYGHLSIASIMRLEEGQKFNKGDCLAFLGDPSVNGDYPPHLHFQIIKDIQGFKGDYPGVCSKDDLSFYSNNCPNPLLLLKNL